MRNLRPRMLLIVVVLAAGAVPLQAQTPDALHWQIPGLDPPSAPGPSEYAHRRSLLMESVGDEVLVVFGAPVPEADYLPFHQTSDFRYLTGITEPGAALILKRAEGRVEEWLFVQPSDPAREVWEGRRLGTETASTLSGAPAQTNDRIIVVLDSLLAGATTLLTLSSVPLDPAALVVMTYEQQVLWRTLTRHPGLRTRSVSGILRRMRARKSETELDLIRRAVLITAEAHREAMRAAWPAMNEFEIEALVEYIFARHGAGGPAYASIVGSGPNATTLHYDANDRFMQDGDLLLMDVGASYAGYAADVTRTIPVTGSFTPDQRAIYDIVLAAHEAAAAQLRLGATWNDLNAAANTVIANGLTDLGLIDAPDATYDCGDQTCAQWRLFYMHGLGHGVGLDVHDPDISTFDGFQPGSAITIEPGIYIRRDAFDHLPDTPGNRAMTQRLRGALNRYADTGVRIEDVYLFWSDGVERASAGVPREADDIEQLMREASAYTVDRRGDVVEWRRGGGGTDS